MAVAALLCCGIGDYCADVVAALYQLFKNWLCKIAISEEDYINVAFPR